MQQEMALVRLYNSATRTLPGTIPASSCRERCVISYDINNGNRRIAPDLFISFNVDNPTIRENLPNYWMWEIGKGAGVRNGSCLGQHGVP